MGHPRDTMSLRHTDALTALEDRRVQEGGLPTLSTDRVRFSCSCALFILLFQNCDSNHLGPFQIYSFFILPTQF